MVAVIQLKRHMASTYILSINISKLGRWQKPCPVILFKVNKNLEIKFYCTVLIFNPAIYLSIGCYEKSLFDSKEIIEQRPEFWDK